jgi:hypothetical protein
MQAFWTMPLLARVVVAASTLSGVPRPDVELAVRTIKTSGENVHDGRDPPTQPKLTSLVR